MNMDQRNPRRPASRGFTLVELLVAIVLAMLAVLVITQTLRVSSAAQRQAVGADDARTAGALAVAALQRDIRQAGVGLGDPRLLGCGLELASGRQVATLAPVVINSPQLPPGDAMTDTLLVAYGSDAGLPQGAAVAAEPTAGTYAVASPAPIAVGDSVIGSPAVAGAPCQLRMAAVAAVSASSPTLVQAARPLADTMTGGRLFNMGPHPQLLAYAVRGGQLTRCDFLQHDCGDAGQVSDPAVWTRVASQIVSLRAEYGLSHGSTPTAPVDEYSQATPASGCGWMHTPVVRLALVVRNSERERNAVPQSGARWAGSDLAPISLDAVGADWDHYRYSTFETMVPMRNVAWRAQEAAC
jgi:type IV pilus assembly protein PilW